MLYLSVVGARWEARSRRLLLFAAAAAVALGLMATVAKADQTINVPCAGDPAHSGPQGLVNAIIKANTTIPAQKTTINVTNDCAYDFTSSSGSPDNSPTALPQITSTIVINGQGGPDEPAIIMRSTASGTPAFRLIDVKAGGNLTLNSVQVTNGLSLPGTDGTPTAGNGTDGANGGGIYSSGTLTLQDSVVSGNDAGNGGNGAMGATGDANGGKGGNGGGIYNNGGSVNTNGGDHVSGNDAGNGGKGGTTASGNANGGAGGNGGGIFHAGSGTDKLQDNTTLSSNGAGNGGAGGTSSGTATGGNGGNGGSLDSASGTTVTISGGNTNVEQSTSGTGGQNGNASSTFAPSGDGGGVFTAGTVSTNGAMFTSNVAGGPEQASSGKGDGGGLAAEGSSASVTIQKGSFTHNVAATGGAIFANGGAMVMVSGTTVANNTTPQCVGASGC